MIKIPVPMGALPPSIQAAMSPQRVQATEDPASTIADSGSKIVEAYERYDQLRVLTSQLNGLQESAPLPSHVEIDEVVIRFRINGVEKTATTRTVRSVGDLYRLLALETERLVGEMRDQALRAKEAAATVEEACSRSQYVANARQSPPVP